MSEAGTWAAVAIAIVLFLVAVTWADGRRTRRRYPARGGFVTVDGIRVHFERRGRGRPVVLVHGAFASARDYAGPLFDELAQEFDVIAIDRPGQGYSDPIRDKPPTPAAHARVIHRALREIGVERPILVGHSWGGAVVLADALDRPREIAGVVAVAPYAFPPWRRASPFAPLLRLVQPLVACALWVLAAPVGIVTGRLFTRVAFAPNPIATGLAEETEAFARRPRQMAAEVANFAVTGRALREAAERYPGLSVPLAIVAGDSDPIAPLGRHARPLHEAVPGSRLVVLPRVGHMVHVAEPMAVVRAVREVATVAAPASGGGLVHR